MTEWVVSMHGATVTYASIVKGTPVQTFSKRSYVKVPEEREIYFYVREKKSLFGGWKLYYHLMGGPGEIAKAKRAAVEVKRSGELVPNYYLAGDNEWIDKRAKIETSASGIFVAGNRNSAESWEARSDTHWDLEFVLNNTRKEDKIHWIACRAWF